METSIFRQVIICLLVLCTGQLKMETTVCPCTKCENLDTLHTVYRFVPAKETYIFLI